MNLETRRMATSLAFLTIEISSFPINNHCRSIRL